MRLNKTKRQPIKRQPEGKKNEIMPFAATWMELEIIILSEVSQTAKDTYPIISLIGLS